MQALSGTGAPGGSGDAGGGAAPGAAGAAGGGAPAGAAAPSGGAVTHFWDGWLPQTETKPEVVEARTWIAAKNYQDPLTFVKSARDWETQAATLRAGKGYPVAKANPDGTPGKIDDNQWKAWNLAVGVPESADKYEVPSDPTFPNYSTYMKQAFLKAGVPAEMAKTIGREHEAAIARVIAEAKAQEDSQSQLALMELKQSWGTNAVERLSIADRGRRWMADKLGGVTEEQWRGFEALFGTAKTLTMLYEFAAGNREVQGAGGGAPPALGAGSAAEAQAELDRINHLRMTDAKSAEAQWNPTEYAKRTDPLMQRIVAGMTPQ
jgi:hypothetical protein